MKTQEKLVFCGDFSSGDFCEWALDRANRLALTGWVRPASTNEIEVVLYGDVEMIDAMELACSLGPMSAIVDHVVRTQRDMCEKLSTLNEFQIWAE